MAVSTLPSTTAAAGPSWSVPLPLSPVQEEQPGSGSARVPQLRLVGARAASRSTALMPLRLQAYALQRYFLWRSKRERPLNPL